MKADVLEACPLCGSAKIKLVGSQRPYWIAKCEACGCTGGLCMTKEHAHTSWDTRAASPLQSRADRAEALLLDLFVVIGELTKGLDPNDSIYAEIQTLGQRYAEFLLR